MPGINMYGIHSPLQYTKKSEKELAELALVDYLSKKKLKKKYYFKNLMGEEEISPFGFGWL
jgi:hypothetical protein